MWCKDCGKPLGDSKSITCPECGGLITNKKPDIEYVPEEELKTEADKSEDETAKIDKEITINKPVSGFSPAFIVVMVIAFVAVLLFLQQPSKKNGTKGFSIFSSNKIKGLWSDSQSRLGTYTVYKITDNTMSLQVYRDGSAAWPFIDTYTYSIERSLSPQEKEVIITSTSYGRPETCIVRFTDNKDVIYINCPQHVEFILKPLYRIK